MFIRIIKDIIAANEGSEPQAFQFVTEPAPNASLFQQVFAIDLRALAALRIALGAICLIFVYVQIPHVELFYSERGILTNGLSQQLLGSGFWSLMWLVDSVSHSRLLLIATGIAALGFALGTQTRLMNVVLLVLVWSVQMRNPLVLTGGDVLLRMMLFWLVFLPAGRIWSFDSWRRGIENDDWKIANFATMAIMLQLVFMYFFSGLSKLNAFWFSGDAVHFAMSLEMSVKPAGRWLLQFPLLMKFATYATLVTEIATLVVMFIPRINHFNRGVMFAFFLLMHIAIWCTMSIGLFSLTAIVAWLIFIPSDIFNTLIGEPVGFSEQNFYRSKFPLSEKLVDLAAGSFLILVVSQNILAATPLHNQIRILNQLSRTTMTVQEFHMFARPPALSPWFEYNAQLTSGRSVDIFYPERGSITGKPKSVYDYLQNQNWRRIHLNLITHPVYPPHRELIYQEIRQRMLEKIVNRWDSKFVNEPVKNATLQCHLEPIPFPANSSGNGISFTNQKSQSLEWATYQQSPVENEQNMFDGL